MTRPLLWKGVSGVTRGWRHCSIPEVTGFCFPYSRFWAASSGLWSPMPGFSSPYWQAESTSYIRTSGSTRTLHGLYEVVNLMMLVLWILSSLSIVAIVVAILIQTFSGQRQSLEKEASKYSKIYSFHVNFVVVGIKYDFQHYFGWVDD